MTALVIADAQAAFAEYESASGSTIETTQQQAIVSLFIQLLQNLPGAATVTTPVAPASAPSVQTQVATKTLL
jgi:hypothetical protein